MAASAYLTEVERLMKSFEQARTKFINAVWLGGSRFDPREQVDLMDDAVLELAALTHAEFGEE